MSNSTFDRLRSMQSMFIPYVIGAVAAVLKLFNVDDAVTATVTGIMTVLNGVFGKYLDLRREDYNSVGGDDNAG